MTYAAIIDTFMVMVAGAGIIVAVLAEFAPRVVVADEDVTWEYIVAKYQGVDRG